MSISPPGFIVVDASVWVARLVPQDSFYPMVKAWMETQRSAGMMYLSPALLLPEMAGAISRRTGDNRLAHQAVERLQRLASVRLVEMDQSLVQAATRLAADLGLRGADSMYVALAARLNLPLVTLDRDQRTKAASKISVQFLEDQENS